MKSVSTSSNNIKQGLIPFFVIVSVIFIGLFFTLITIRGEASLTFFGKTLSTKAGGPFESSNSNARYALTKSMVENKSFFLTRDLAIFSSPDVVVYKGKYLSIFTPGVSFAAIPLYFVGKLYGLEQIFTYLLNPILAVLCMVLIVLLGKKVTGSYLAGSLSSLVFLLGTNALAFSQTFTQHFLSAFIILMSIINAIYFKGYKKYILAGFLLGMGVLADIPNLFALLPALIVVAGSAIEIRKLKEKISLRLSFKSLVFVLGVLPFVLLFAYYNITTTGSLTRLAQFIGRTTTIAQDSEITAPQVDSEKGKIELPFDTRKLVGGLYTLILSNDRGIFFYSPVMALGVLGIFLAFKNKETETLAAVSVATVCLIFLTYGMFGDPWGGWSFGPRYLIPAQAIISVFLSFALSKFANKPVFAIIFALIVTYSLFIGMLGALTTSSVPPRIEAINFPDHTPYTYKFNLNRILENRSNSYLYNSQFAGKMPLSTYLAALVTVEVGIVGICYVLLVRKK